MPTIAVPTVAAVVAVPVPQPMLATAVVQGPQGPRGASGKPITYAIRALDGQSILPLSPAPTDVNSLILTINGAAYTAPDVATSDVAVTWQGPFALAATDAIRVSYY